MLWYLVPPSITFWYEYTSNYYVPAQLFWLFIPPDPIFHLYIQPLFYQERLWLPIQHVIWVIAYFTINLDTSSVTPVTLKTKEVSSPMPCICNSTPPTTAFWGYLGYTFHLLGSVVVTFYLYD